MKADAVDEFLGRIKAEGRSSPNGQYWDSFYKLLCRHADRGKESRPPAPLILAASGESSSVKHQRLEEQLRWAAARGILPEALQFLANLQPDQWNCGAAADWHRESYWRP